MKTLILSIIILLNLIQGNYLEAQAPEILWEHGYGGNYDDRGQCIIKGNINGFIVAGYSNSIDGDIDDNHGGTDISILKISEEGEIEWQRNYGGSEMDRCISIISALDGGYILTGSTYSSDGDFTINKGGADLCILKIDEFGNILWSKTYGGSEGDSGGKIIATLDGNYLITGSSASNDFDVSGNHGISDYWILKIDINGNILWDYCYGSSDYDIPYDVLEVPEGFLIFGYSDGLDNDVSVNHGGPDCWLLKINFEGDIIFDKSYGGSLTDAGYGLVKGTSETYYCVGTTYSNDDDVTLQHGASDCWILKIDSTGNLLNQKTFGGGDFEDCFDIIVMDEKLIIAGGSASADGDISENLGSSDYLFASFDSLLNLQWEKTIGGSENEIAYSLIESDANAIMSVGYSFSSDFDVTETYLNPNYWVVKFKFCLNHYFADTDTDGFGDLFNDTLACELPLGYVTDSTDCNDTNETIYPSAEDICNAIDDNCNGTVDEDATVFTWYLDNDGDNFGNNAIDSLTCFDLDGYVFDSTDCNDTNPNIYPGAVEILNGLDDDCDGLTDENLAINNQLIDAIKIYPNPAETILHIEYFGNTVCMIEILSFTGQVIFQNEISSSTIIDISKFASGIYFLKIIGIDGEVGVKVVKE